MNIRVENLKKYFKNQLVLDIDELDIKSGAITCVMGSNGSGKSTLINIIAGLLEDYEGTVYYDKQKLNKNIMMNMTLAFQNPYLMRQSVWENIEYPLKIRNIDKVTRDEMIENIIEDFGISELKYKKANQLSGGEGQKVSLARAMVFKPKLLLLDEPTASVDKEYTKIIEDKIKRYNENTNSTVIIITHSMGQAKDLSDEIIYLEKGRIEEWNKITFHSVISIMEVS